MSHYCFLQEEAAQHHAQPPYGPKPEDSHHLHRAGPYPSLHQYIKLPLHLTGSTVLKKWIIFTAGETLTRSRSIHYSSVLHLDSDVRVGPEIVTDPAFLVTRLVPAL